MGIPNIPSPVRVIRDPIHGNISIYPLEEAILETEVFQRLRFVSQLSLCSLVYPGAVHNRFSHSLGAMHLGGQMYSSLVSNSPDEEFDFDIFQAVRLTCMLHDIGHGPFSHVFERAVNFFARKNQRIKEFHHEKMGLKLVKELFKNKIDSKIHTLAINLLEKKSLSPENKYLSQIVSSEFDADRCDFLLRDSYFAGVSYGKFELPRLMDTMVITHHPDNLNERLIAFKKKSLMALENFIFSRANMYRGVYFHHTNLAGDAMISRGIFELLQREVFPIKAITDPLEFTKWNDSRIYGLFHEIINENHLNTTNPNIRTISGLLVRNLWKRLPVDPQKFNFEYNNMKEYANRNNIDIDLIIEKINVKKIPYTHLPYRSIVGHPNAIYLIGSSNELIELSNIMKIQIPEDFILNQQLLVHPDYLSEIRNLINN